jgi:hypothetical protein
VADNLRHWSALSKTDPNHTKPFKRSGGFGGTAIKPIWTELRMTEHFGPCGVGWGMYQPEFKLVPIEGNNEVLVFCTVGLWYVEDGKDLSPTELPCVYGVGGDKVVARGRDGLRTSDEAFKSAYTDALSNAMKHLGVAADVHMGRFDDSKYVASMRAEFAGPREPGDDSHEVAPVKSQPLIENQARGKASFGWDVFRGWYIGLSDEDRLALRPHIGELQTAARKADEEKEGSK